VPNAGGNVNDIFWKRKWLHSRAEIRRSNIQARVRGHLPDPPGSHFFCLILQLAMSFSI
jgi:hypothetical protein